MLRAIFFLTVICSVLRISAQTPTTCFEIENVLADACSAPEGENEMVRFRVGQNPLNISDLSVEWPNVANLFNGICKNATTAQIVNTINSTITGCGILIEPTGVLPAGASVLLITSENVQPLAHSFVNLNDTLYVIFQCALNTAGHFANFGSGLRTLVISFGNPPGCSDTVEYDRSLLVNIYDSTGGSTASQDGSSIAYAWDGTPTYYNNGCVAPFIPLVADAGNDTAACAGSALQLNGAEEGATGRFWSSAQGTFNNAAILHPVFTPNANAAYPLEVILSAYTVCDTIADTLLIHQLTGSVNAGSDVVMCNGQSVQLNGSGSNTYSWSTSAGVFVSNQQNPTVNPAATTTYILTGNFGAANCPDADTVTVTVNAKDSISIIASADSVCAGESFSVTASGGSSYLWSPDDGSISDIHSSSPNITPFASTTYSVQSTGSCADTATFFITVIPQDTISISASGTTACAGDTVQLTATGGTDYLWMPATGLSCADCSNPIAVVNDSITYSVGSSGFCPSQADISLSVLPNITISVSPDTTILRGQSATLTASGGSDYLWTPAAGLNATSGATVIASPENTTTYFVTENNYACATQGEVTVIVQLRECPLPLLPTAFSPNADGFNDFFGLLNPENFSSIEFRVYNRWGEKVFETLTGQKWDGSYKGEPQPLSTFAYLLTAVCDNGERVKLSGSVTLLK